MKLTNSPATVAILAMAATMMPEAAEARSYGSLLAPRSYQYNRPRDPFDLVGEFFHTPFYNVNSLLKQQQAATDRLAHSTSPRYAVSEEKGVVQLEVELPGVFAKDLDVELEDDSMLRIKGSRHLNGSESTFDLSFQLADGVDPDGLTVKLSAGILRVQVPKKEKTVKKLQIVTDEPEDEILHIKSSKDETGGEKDDKVDEITITEEE